MALHFEWSLTGGTTVHVQVINSPFSLVLDGPSFEDVASLMSCALLFYILVQISPWDSIPVDGLYRKMIVAIQNIQM